MVMDQYSDEDTIDLPNNYYEDDMGSELRVFEEEIDSPRPLRNMMKKPKRLKPSKALKMTKDLIQVQVFENLIYTGINFKSSVKKKA